MKKATVIPGILIIFFCFLLACQQEPGPDNNMMKTVCNPVDLSYRFEIDSPSRRAAADPTVVLFKDKYYLFASKSGGYWYSDDLATWNFIETNEIPTEDWAPTAVAIGDTIYFLASSQNSAVYYSTNPLTGKWEIARDSLQFAVHDPVFLLDDDDRLYLYWGCSNNAPLYGVELDKNDFSVMGEIQDVIYSNREIYGWEVRGDYNEKTEEKTYMEGAWINKYNGKYYMQYSTPGTQFKSYNDGVYVSDNPLGPFKLGEHNPFAYKPEGFANGAGHGSTFIDKYGNFWHFGTVSISQKHNFERRISMYPTFFDEDGILFSTTGYGDYPMIIPEKKITERTDLFAGLMLLSYFKKVQVSSTLDSFYAENMVDENIRTYWAAETGDNSEYAIIDLGNKYDVHAIQINFAEHDANIYGRQKNLFHQYTIESSVDSINWTTFIDKAENDNDNSHDYTQLKENIEARYLKISNIEVPGGKFAISGFRVFGKGEGEKPKNVEDLIAVRDSSDRRKVHLNWTNSENATGYNISYGIAKNKLYHNYLVYNDTSLTINSLNTQLQYYFTIEAFNENGITLNDRLVKVD